MPPSTPPPSLGELFRAGPTSEAGGLFDRQGPVADAAQGLTDAVHECGSAGLGPDFPAETRAPLATLVGAWRRAGLPERRLIDGLAELGDGMVDRLEEQSVERSQAELVQSASAILDATQNLIRRTQRTFRSWRDRSEADEAFSVAVFGEALGHEIRNRIHAARTALELLRDPAGLDPADRTRLQGLLRDAVVAARRAVFDVRLVTAEDPRHDVPVTAALHELLRRTVARQRIVAEEAGISIEVLGAVPSVHVDARRAQVVLNNILDVAARLLAEAGGSTLQLRTHRPDGRGYVEISVEGDRLFLEEGHEDVLFQADIADIAEGGAQTEPAQLGLWLTREAVAQLGGDLTLVRQKASSADALVVRLPVGAPRDPSS